MKRLMLSATCVAALMVTVQPASAQDKVSSAQAAGAGASAAAAGNDAQDNRVPEIVVTAQRRAENLQRAAVAVSAISGDALASAGVTRPTELTSVIPALQVAPAAGPYNLFYLRGVGNFNSNAFSDSAVAFNFDGVYIGRPSSSTGFFYDLERVEVLKGPQGTLYGRNATGGAINVISKKPELGVTGGSASLEYGDYDSLRLDGAVNLPIGDKAAVRIAGVRVRHDGYMNDGTDDQDDLGGRASLRVEPTDSLSINLVADYFQQRGAGTGMTPLLAPNGVAAPTAFNPDDRIGIFSTQGQAFYTSQPAGTLGRNFYPFPTGYKQFLHNSYWGIAGTVDWRSSLGTLTIVPAYREGHLDYNSYVPGFQSRQIEDDRQTSVEARFATNEDHPLRALIGAFYYKEDSNVPAIGYVSNWNGQYDTGPRLSTESEAIFGRLTYAITPDFRLNVGGRQTWDDKSFVGQRLSFTRICLAASCPDAPPLPYGLVPPPERVTGPLASAPTVLQTVLSLNENEQADFKKFTWRAGADWDITPQNLLYASFETGFKAGGFYFSPTTGTFSPENIDAFTLGSKNRFFDNRLQINVELFHWRYKDQQLSHLINIGGIPTFATENVGRATFKGFEVEATVAATSTTTLNADIQYLDAQYNQFVFRQANLGRTTSLTAFNGTACPTTAFDAATGNSFIVDCSGMRPPNAPEWTINMGVQQKVPVSFGEFVLEGRTHYQTQTLTGLEFLPVEYQKAYWLADAQVTFYPPQRNFSVSAFVNNMFDKTVKSQMFPTPGTNFFATTLRPPRTYGLRVGFNF